MVPECSWWPIAAIHQPYTSAIFHNSTKLAIPRKCQHTHTQCTQQRKMLRLRMIHETLRSKIFTEFCFYLSQVLRKSDRDYNNLIVLRLNAMSFKDHTKNIAIWGSFLTLSLIVYLSLSSGDFSFLLVLPLISCWTTSLSTSQHWNLIIQTPQWSMKLQTYSSFMRCFGFGLLIFKMLTSWSSKGISLKTLELYILTFSVRLFSIMRHQGYLPYDKTGDWFYHVVSRTSDWFLMSTGHWHSLEWRLLHIFMLPEQ